MHILTALFQCGADRADSIADTKKAALGSKRNQQNVAAMVVFITGKTDIHSARGSVSSYLDNPWRNWSMQKAFYFRPLQLQINNHLPCQRVYVDLAFFQFKHTDDVI